MAQKGNPLNKVNVSLPIPKTRMPFQIRTHSTSFPDPLVLTLAGRLLWGLPSLGVCRNEVMAVAPRILWPNAFACLLARKADATVSGKKTSVKRPSHT
jgi:hypothetical protein